MKTLLFTLCLLCPLPLWAQLYKISPEDTQRRQSYLIMRDGSVVRGQVIRQDSMIITIRRRGGDLSFIEADQLVSVTPARPVQPMLSAPGNTPALYPVFILKDGSQVEGRFVRRDSTMITIRKRNGQLTYFEPELLVRVDSVQVEAVDGIKPVIPNQFSPWLLTGQTAHTAEQGRFYYRNTLLLLNQLDYGISRNWSVGASVNPFYRLLNEGYNNPREAVLSALIRFSTKLSFPIGDQFRFGVNASYQPRQQAMFFPLADQWIIQGLATFGDSQRNATLGYGQNRYGGNFPTTAPFITAGVMHKLSRTLTFLSDNAFYISSLFLQTSLSAALRLDRRRHAFDLGAIAAVYPKYYSGSRAFFSPYIGYNLLIGRD